MKDSLTKNQLVWVLIRFLGVYFVCHAIIAFCALMGATLMTNQMRSGLPSASSGFDASFIFTAVLSVAAPAVIGIYLLNSGRTIHGWMMTEQSNDLLISNPNYRESTHGPSPSSRRPSPKKKVDPATTLTAEETDEFLEWINDHTEYQNRPQADQIALFRDAQKSGEAHD